MSAVVPLTNVTFEQSALKDEGALDRLRTYVARVVAAELENR